MSKFMDELNLEITKKEAKLVDLREQYDRVQLNDVQGQLDTAKEITKVANQVTALQKFRNRLREMGIE